jgi:hypothetical protein
MTESDWSPSALKICFVCDTIWLLSLISGSAYIVFWLGNSGWWFLLTLLLLTCFNCKKYRSPSQLEADLKSDDDKDDGL